MIYIDFAKRENFEISSKIFISVEVNLVGFGNKVVIVVYTSAFMFCILTY